jgi:hypothetical protein
MPAKVLLNFFIGLSALGITQLHLNRKMGRRGKTIATILLYCWHLKPLANFIFFIDEKRI